MKVNPSQLDAMKHGLIASGKTCAIEDSNGTQYYNATSSTKGGGTEVCTDGKRTLIEWTK